MAEETQAQQAEEPAAEQAGEPVDWQAKYEAMREHSRDWERKAKANQSAADELEKLRAEQMTEQERLEKRASDAESELARLKAESERYEAALAISKETGVPTDVLMYCSDSESMADFAKRIQEEQPAVHAAARAGGSRVLKGEGKRTNAQVFADAVSDLL